MEAYVRVRFAVYLVLRLLAGTMHGGGPQSQGPGMSHLPKVEETMVAETEPFLGDVWSKGQFWGLWE